jgi:hypothetical protein
MCAICDENVVDWEHLITWKNLDADLKEMVLDSQEYDGFETWELHQSRYRVYHDRLAIVETGGNC